MTLNTNSNISSVCCFSLFFFFLLLYDLCRAIQRKILDEIITCTESWKVLVMDTMATRVASSSLTMYDIMEQRVTIVENLSLNRSPFPNMEVVYFCAPTPDNIKAIADDFKDLSSPKYGGVHLFFTYALEDELFNQLKMADNLIPRVRTLKEINLEFLAMESNAFSLDMKDAIPNLFGSTIGAGYVNTMIRRLTTACISLQENPCIRYQGSSILAKNIAEGLNRNLQTFKRNNATFKFNGDDAQDDRERAQILILDRTFDPLSPFMHEYTYQAMVYDLLNVEEDNQIEFIAKTDGKQEVRTALLKDDDAMWVEFRHSHIASVINNLRERMADITANNASAQVMKAKSSGDTVDISVMAAAVKGISEYKQTVGKLTQHVEIAQMCMREFTGSNLLELSEVEQSISTGVDDAGSTISRSALLTMAINGIKSVTRNDERSKQLRKRLLAIFVVAQRPNENELQQLLTAANFITAADQQFVLNLNQFCRAQDQERASTSKSKGFFSSFFGGQKEAVKHKATAEGEYADTRHQCLLKTLMDQLITAQLPSDKYPATGPSISVSSEIRAGAKSVRRFAANSRWNKKENSVSGGRYLCFVAGGIGFNELRSAYELQQQHSKEIVIGGTSFVDPNSYTQQLTALRR
jgi:syntaxin-binding protein 1